MKSAVINRATSGNGTAVIAAVSGKTLRIYGYVFQAAGTVNAKFQSGDGTTQVDLTGAMPQVANSGVSHSSGRDPCFIVPAGKGFYLNLDAAVQVSGHVSYSVGP